MTSESLKIIKMMVEEGLTVEEVVSYFNCSIDEIALINQYIKENKRE